MFFEQMHPRWQSYLADQQDLLNRIERQVRAASDLVPALDLVMRAFSTDPNEIRVVLLGQDPYPNPGDAIGLAFAITEDRKSHSRSKTSFVSSRMILACRFQRKLIYFAGSIKAYYF